MNDVLFHQGRKWMLSVHTQKNFVYEKVIWPVYLTLWFCIWACKAALFLVCCKWPRASFSFPIFTSSTMPCNKASCWPSLMKGLLSSEYLALRISHILSSTSWEERAGVHKYFHPTMKITHMQNTPKLPCGKKNVLLLIIPVIPWSMVFCSDIPLICKPLGVKHKVNEASPLRLLISPHGSQRSAAPGYMHLLSKETMQKSKTL